LTFLLWAFCGWKEIAAQNGYTCDTAIALSPGQSISSTTAGVPAPSNNNINLIQCVVGGFVSVDNPGVWFVYDATTSRDLLLSTCAQETTSPKQITAFAMGVGNCTKSACIASSSKADMNCSYPNSTVLNVSVAAGTTYSFFVNDEASGESGAFGLSVVDMTPSPASASCNAAVELRPNETLQGTTVGASVDTALQCNHGGPKNPGVFFYIPPVTVRTGISISLTGGENVFDVRVFGAPSCLDLACITVKTSTEGNTIYAFWMAEKGQGFFVYVSVADTAGTNVTDRFGIYMAFTQSPTQASAASSVPIVLFAMLSVLFVMVLSW